MINRRIFNLCKDSKKYIFLKVLTTWIALVCNISIIMIIGSGLEKVLQGSYLPSGSYALAVFALLTIRFICNIYSSKFSGLAAARAKYTLRQSIYQKLLRLGSEYVNSISTSNTIQIAVEGVEALDTYFSNYLPQLVYALLAPLTLFTALSFISVKVALILLISVPLIPISIIAVMRLAKKRFDNFWGSYTDLGHTFLENLQGLTTLKVYDIDHHRQQKMNDQAENFRKATMKVLSMQLNSINVMDLIAYGGAAAGIVFALLEFKAGLISPGALLVIILLSAEFFLPLRLLGSFFHVAMSGIAASDHIFRLLDLKEPNSNLEMSLPVPTSVLMTMQQVFFTYDQQREVLRDINLTINKGSFTALVGPSGSGKSTIAALILKFYRAERGEIRFHNRDIADLAPTVLAEKISLLAANSYIFGGTILNNLLMAKADATQTELARALQHARLAEFVEKLPDKMDTEVGEGGCLLSGGQRQRLALARVLLADRDFIIFDEATSNIDIESESQIWQAIQDLVGKKTILAITHRLRSIASADQIYVLDKGSIAESGNHQSLLSNGGVYAQLWLEQQALENIRK